MKRNILAVVIPALLVAGAANAAEIYNKNGITMVCGTVLASLSRIAWLKKKY